MTPYKTSWGDQYLYICTTHDEIREFASKIVDLVDIAKDMGISMEAGLTGKNDEIQKLNEKIIELKVEIKELKKKNRQLKKQVEKKKEK